MNIFVTEETFEDCLLEIMSLDKVAIDTETTGLRLYHTDRLFSIVLSCGEKTWYLNFQDYKDNSPVLDRSRIKQLQPLFDGRLLFMHNAKFDMTALAKEGLDVVVPIHDTQVVARIIYNDYQKYNLDSCVERDLGKRKDDRVKAYMDENFLFRKYCIPGKKTEEKLYFFDQVPFDLISEYACMDGALTYELGMKQLEQLEALRKWDLDARSIMNVYNSEKRLTPVCYKMERLGLFLDREFCEEAVKHEFERYSRAEKLFFEQTKTELVNSGKALGPIFEGLGFKPGRTETGDYEINDYFLESVDHPVAKTVLEYRDAHKRCNTYFRGFLYHVDEHNMVHANIRQSGTRTGRFSLSDPNLQNLSKDEDLAQPFPVRRAFKPRPGRCFVMIDYKTMEFRMMMDYAGERQVIRQINNGMDAHQAVADQMNTTRSNAKCIAKGQLVLTNMGLVPIEKVTKDLLVWDGFEYVAHTGVISKGVQDVFELNGLIGTREHKVYTKDGRIVRLEKAILQQLELAVCEHSGSPIRYSHYDKPLLRGRLVSSCITGVLGLWESVEGAYIQFVGWKNAIVQMSKEQKAWPKFRLIEGRFTRSLLCSGTALQQCIKSCVLGLWRSWNSVQAQLGGVCAVLFPKLLQSTVAGISVRQDRQQWALRDREHSVRTSQDQRLQQAQLQENKIQWAPGECTPYVASAKDGFPKPSSDSVYSGKALKTRGLNREHPSYKGQTEVYDITNAGPRHRFTVSGKLTKNCLSFGLLYGMGLEKFGRALKVSKEEAKKLKYQYFDNLPMVEGLIKRAKSTADIRQNIINWHGRIYQFQDPRFTYKAINSLIQGGCADVVHIAMNRIDEYLTANNLDIMALQVHDELIFDCPVEHLHHIPKIKEIMESVYVPQNGLALTCSIEHSFVSLADPVEGLPNGQEA